MEIGGLRICAQAKQFSSGRQWKLLVESKQVQVRLKAVPVVILMVQWRGNWKLVGFVEHPLSLTPPRRSGGQVRGDKEKSNLSET